MTVQDTVEGLHITSPSRLAASDRIAWSWPCATVGGTPCGTPAGRAASGGAGRRPRAHRRSSPRRTGMAPTCSTTRCSVSRGRGTSSWWCAGQMRLMRGRRSVWRLRRVGHVSGPPSPDAPPRDPALGGALLVLGGLFVVTGLRCAGPRLHRLARHRGREAPVSAPP